MIYNDWQCVLNLLPCIDKDSNVGPGLEAKSSASDVDDNYDYIPPDLR